MAESATSTNTTSSADSKRFDNIAKTVQVVSVVIGVIVSVWTFSDTHQKEIAARNLEAKKYLAERQDINERQKAEAAKPFLELRQKAYLEAVQNAAILATADHTPEELTKARNRFKALYIAELSMVESSDVESSMRNLASAVDPSLLNLTPSQQAALNLSHALRDSLTVSWHVDPEIVDANKDSSRHQP